MSKPCHCGMPVEHAKAVESAIMSCLGNAQKGDEGRWRDKADALESKFTTAHGKHYSYFIYPSDREVK